MHSQPYGKPSSVTASPVCHYYENDAAAIHYHHSTCKRSKRILSVATSDKRRSNPAYRETAGAGVRNFFAGVETNNKPLADWRD